jgi:hypothetical protein
MTTRRLTPVLLVGLGALAAGCLETPSPEERLCQDYCYGQFQAVPAQGATSCESSEGDYWDDCVRTCTRDIDASADACHTPILRAYGCGADHGWFCIPKEGGGQTLTQFDTCRAEWDALYACERALPDAGTP